MDNIELLKQFPTEEGEKWRHATANVYISTLGRVIKVSKKGKEKIIKPVYNNNGYEALYYFEGKKLKSTTVHRMAALTFLDHPDDLHGWDVSHIDDNKHNNNISNLKWMKHVDNCNSGERNKKINEKRGYFGVDAYTRAGEFVKHFANYFDASEWATGDRGKGPNICASAKYSKQRAAYGYIWRLSVKGEHLDE